jgi:ABC-2 type transport system ATP-binding protein
VSAPAIQCRGVTHVYDSASGPALNGLTLDVAKGECFGLIGANGAGKTTALRILSTLLVPTSGSASIEGLDVAKDYLRVRALIGYMPEAPPVFSEFTVGEFLSYAAALYGLHGADAQRRVDAVIALTDLGGKRHSPTPTLSQGMRQRLFLARALVHDPPVLLLDEPTSGLDPAARVEFRHIMREMTGLGKTIIVSSHILPELSEFCTAVGIVERGKLVVAGSVAEVLSSIGGTLEIDLEVTGDAAAAAVVLRRIGGVGKIRVDGAKAVIEYSGPRDQQAQLLKALVEAGVPVVSFAPRRATLEQIFMKVAAFETA